MRRFFERIAPYFQKGGKYEKLFPLFEMVETFFYDPLIKTEGKTHIRDGLDLKRTMIIVFLAILPTAIFGIYNVGYQANIAIEAGAKIAGFRHEIMNLFNISYDPNSFLSNFFSWIIILLTFVYSNFSCRRLLGSFIRCYKKT